MDSTTTEEVTRTEIVEGPDGRLHRLVPIVRSLANKVKVLGVVSAGSGLVLWWILFDPYRWGSGLSAGWVLFALLTLIVLLLPAGATLVGNWTLQGILDLPQKLEGTMAEARTHVSKAVEPQRRQSGRLFSFFQAIWSARTLVLDSGGAWGKAVAAAKLARLASLPFVLALLAAFALNFLVIGAALVALMVSTLL